MAWLPILPRSEVVIADANARISFLERFAERTRTFFSPQIAGTEGTAFSSSESDYYIDERAPAPDAATLSAVSALMTAGELALVTDQTKRGRAILQRALMRGTEDSFDQWPILRIAVLGVALRIFDISIEQNGLTIENSSAAGRATLEWGSAQQVLLHAGGLLVGAAVASNKQDRFSGLMRGTGQGQESSAISLLLNVREADVLPLFGIVRGSAGRDARFVEEGPPRIPSGDAVSAFFALHQRYASSLRLQMTGASFFEVLSRAPLFDWALFVLHLGIIRHEITPSLFESVLLSSTDTTARELLGFLVKLAQEFDSERDRPEGDQSSTPPVNLPGGPGATPDTHYRSFLKPTREENEEMLADYGTNTANSD